MTTSNDWITAGNTDALRTALQAMIQAAIEYHFAPDEAKERVLQIAAQIAGDLIEQPRSAFVAMRKACQEAHDLLDRNGRKATDRAAVLSRLRRALDLAEQALPKARTLPGHKF